MKKTKDAKAEKARAVQLAQEWTEHNSQVLQAVWEGRKGRAALMFEDEGGETKRVGWPNGYKKELDKATQAHAKLFTRKAEVPPADKRGRPAGAATRGNDAFSKDAKIKLLADGNPKRPGSAAHEVWKLYEDGMTVSQYYEKGGKVASLKWDSEHGFIKIG